MLHLLGVNSIAPDSLETQMSASGQTAGLVTPAITGPTRATLPSTPVAKSPGITDTLLATSATPTDQGAFLEAALLAHQVLPIPNFSGESSGSEGRIWQEWIDTFELVASECRWSDQANLVNLAMRLKGSAYAFYRSCTAAQHTNYTLLWLHILHP